MPAHWAINGRYVTQRLTGVQRVAHELVAALDRRIAQISAPSMTLLLPPAAPPPPVSALPWRHVPGPAFGPAPGHLWEQWSLPRAARGARLLNLCGAAPAFGAPGQACLLHDAAVFDHPEAYGATFGRWYRWLFRHLARSDARLMTVSAFSRQRLAQNLGVPEARFAVVPLAADHMGRVAPDPAALQRLGLGTSPILLAVGSANPSKRQDDLVHAWQARGRDVARLVSGGGGDARVFGTVVLASAPGVVRTGPVDDATLRALYGAATALVFPSVYEGFGLPPLEAMACGCPVVAAQAASLPEVCGDAALMVPPQDVPALADAMRTLLDDAALRASLRVRGLARAAAFSWDASAQALLRALDDGAAR